MYNLTNTLPADQIFNILSQDPLQNCMNRNILLNVDPYRPWKRDLIEKQVITQK